MIDERNGTSVTGEIIARPDGRARFAGTDIIDAEFETLAQRQEAAPSLGGAAAAVLAGMGILRHGGEKPLSREEVRGRTPLLWALGLLIVGTAFWVAGGHAVLGGAAAPAPSLRVAGLESRIAGAGETALLLIDGEAVNDGGGTAPLPDLAIKVLDKGGRTTHYFLGTNGQPLGPGERFAFSGRLTAPKEGVKSVSVTFREPGE